MVEVAQWARVFSQVSLPEQGTNHVLLQASVMEEVQEVVRVCLRKLRPCYQGSDEEQAGQLEAVAVAALDHQLAETAVPRQCHWPSAQLASA